MRGKTHSDVPGARRQGRGKVAASLRNTLLERLRIHFQLEALDPAYARVHLDEVRLRLRDLPREPLPPDGVGLPVLLGELHVGHVLLESSHHRHLEEGLGEELHLVADLGADEAIGPQHQHLDAVDGLVDQVCLGGDLREPPGDRRLGAHPALNLPRDALLGVVKARQHLVFQLLLLVLLDRARSAFQEDPWIGKDGCEHVVEQVHELVVLTLASRVVRIENERPDHGILLDKLGMLRVQRRVQVLRGRAFQFVHELQGARLLELEEPADAFPNVADAALQRQVRLVAEQLDHDITPSQGTHGHASGLDDIALLCLYGDLGKPQEDLHLVHQAPELGATVDLDVEGGERRLHLGAQVVDVVGEATEVVRRQRREVGGP
mmetsp:Transcript_89609/g.256736  ORF Transcript_89609/g.256736 Transcript_89609/m.256736 type:complete len:378 (-) Transcript_89609:1247-2380(-)